MEWSSATCVSLTLAGCVTSLIIPFGWYVREPYEPTLVSDPFVKARFNVPTAPVSEQGVAVAHVGYVTLLIVLRSSTVYDCENVWNAVPATSTAVSFFEIVPPRPL